jgi:uncharacterized protein YceH (UPF0502 family)
MSSDHLSLAEGRVLGVLVEKQRTVPDTYPLTLNALVAGCNQKSSREPVLSLSETDVQAALDTLKQRSLVVETSGGRVMRYAHNAERALAIPSQSVAILAALLLRGAQTAGELRINTDRMHRFADISALEAFLHELAERPSGGLVAELPRTPGTRETRWAQLLTGPVAATAGHEPPSRALQAEAVTGERPAIDALVTEVAALREEVAALRSELDELRAALPSLPADASPAEPG